MLTLEQIKEKLKDRRPGKVSAATGVSRQTLHKIVNGKCEPTYKVLKALSDYFIADYLGE